MCRIIDLRVELFPLSYVDWQLPNLYSRSMLCIRVPTMWSAYCSRVIWSGLCLQDPCTINSIHGTRWRYLFYFGRHGYRLYSESWSWEWLNGLGTCSRPRLRVLVCCLPVIWFSWRDYGLAKKNRIGISNELKRRGRVERERGPETLTVPEPLITFNWLKFLKSSSLNSPSTVRVQPRMSAHLT